MGEEKKSERRVNRRELLGTAITGAAVLAGYSCLGLKDAVAQYRKTGKPLFSDTALNALFPNTPNAEHKQLLTEAQADPKSFVRNHFTLTAAQEKDLNALTPQELQTIREAIGTAMRENLRIHACCARSAVPGELPVAQSGHLNFTKIVVSEAVTPAQPQSRPAQQQQQRSAPQSRPAQAPALAGNKFGGTLHFNMSGFGR